MKSLKEVMQIVRNAIDSQGVNLGLCGLSGSLRDENILTTQEHELLINQINTELKHPKGRFKVLKNIDEVMLDTLEYFASTNFMSIAWSQGGDWFGGDTNFNKPPKRKIMNSWFCSTKRRFQFFSRLNEDVNVYMVLGHQGKPFMTIPFIQLDQMQTQATDGGMSAAYLAGGTYVKSFYTVMCRPDCTRINLMGRTQKRLHHLIKWPHACPVIIDAKHKKVV